MKRQQEAGGAGRRWRGGGGGAATAWWWVAVVVLGHLGLVRFHWFGPIPASFPGERIGPNSIPVQLKKAVRFGWAGNKYGPKQIPVQFYAPWIENLAPDSGNCFQRTRRDGSTGRDGVTAARGWRPRGDVAAARGGCMAARRMVAARHSLDGDGDGDGDRLPSFVHSLCRLLTGNGVALVVTLITIFAVWLVQKT